MRAAASSLFCLTLLALAVLSVAKLMSNAPAFNVALRTESVLGDWRVPVRSAVYNKADYQFQIGFGYLRGDAAALLFGDEALPSFEDMSVNLDTAAQHFARSLESAPGHATVWTSLAWARLIPGDATAAADALQTSWGLAPFSNKEAVERLGLVEALDQELPGFLAEAAVTQAFLNDMRTVRAYDPRYFDLFLADFPRFAHWVN